MKKGQLFLIPIPISPEKNSTLSPLVISAIKECQYFLVENVRTARRFISSLNLGLKIEDLEFQLLDKNTQPQEVQPLFSKVKIGQSIGIMSEAGCPGIADPGALAVDYAHKNDIKVIPLVGPSSIFLALMASGFNGQSFVFHGYLPIDKNERKLKIKEMEKSSKKLQQTQLFMDTPYRNNQLLQDLVTWCDSKTMVSVATDLTAKSEFIKTTRISEWKRSLPDLHKRPTIFSIYVG